MKLVRLVTWSLAILALGACAANASPSVQTDDAMFMVITDDEAWAKDAIAQLP